MSALARSHEVVLPSVMEVMHGSTSCRIVDRFRVVRNRQWLCDEGPYVLSQRITQGLTGSSWNSQSPLGGEKVDRFHPFTG